MSLEQYVGIVFNLRTGGLSRAGFGTLIFIERTDEDPAIDASFASFQELEDSNISGLPYDAGLEAFSQAQGFSRYRVLRVAEATDWADALDAAELGGEYYAVLISEADATAGDLEDLVSQIQARERLLFVKQDIAGAELLTAANRFRIVPVTHDAGVEKMAGAWTGKMLPQPAGAVNWAWQVLQGITPQSYTPSEIIAMREARLNYYDQLPGQGVTMHGMTAAPGWYIDLVRGLDWVKARMQEAFANRQIQGPPIRYLGDEATIEQVLRVPLSNAVERGLIDEGYEIHVPRGIDQAAADREERHFPNILIDMRVRGFVNSINVRAEVVI